MTGYSMHCWVSRIHGTRDLGMFLGIEEIFDDCIMMYRGEQSTIKSKILYLARHTERDMLYFGLHKTTQ